jgi:protocatechuate 3,4-dioxygenase, alpha subunit
MTLPVTGSQTVGPYFRIGMAQLFREDLASEGVSGVRVTIHGRVLDGDGAPIPDATIEIWQADAQGKYFGTEFTEQTSFRGFARVPTNDRGEFRFITIKPGSVAGPSDSVQAPHLVVLVFMRGLLRHLVTRIYFADEAANQSDPILKLVPTERRHTLLAKPENADAATFAWNVRLQGDDETVFFDV